MKRTRSLLCLLLILTAIRPAAAIINCFDYAFYRATGVDARSASSPFNDGLGVSSIECYLAAMGYSKLTLPVTSDGQLRPGDVLIFGTAHAGFVDSNGKIDHFIQVWGTAGDKHSASTLPPAKLYLPANRVTWPDPPDNKHSGNFLDQTLAQFIASAFKPAGQVFQWRKTGPEKISAQNILRLEVLTANAEAALKAGEVNKAAKAFEEIVGINEAPDCLATRIASIKNLIGEYFNCDDFITSAEASANDLNIADAEMYLAKAISAKCGTDPNKRVLMDAIRRLIDEKYKEAMDSIREKVAACEFEEAKVLGDKLSSYPAANALIYRDFPLLSRQAEAQRKAREFLRAGLEAIQRKDLAAASAALGQASAVRDLPPCMTTKITETQKKIESFKNFTTLTEQVEKATINCDYKEAARLVGEITRLTPREQYITDWLNVTVPKLAELQNRERKALALIKQAESLATQAETESNKDPVDENRVKTLVQQTMNLLAEADKEAPKCMPDRNKMEDVRRRLTALANRKKPEITTSIVLLIDTSGSMSENNKMGQAKDAAKRAARQVSKTTEIAILHFDGGCDPGAMRTAAGFSTDLNTLLAAIDGLRPGGGTPMYIATAEAVAYAQKQGRGKGRTVILMSDGGDSCRDQQAKAGAAIRSSNIPVSTIGFDVDNNQQAQGDLGNLATMTGGRTFSASAADPREIIRAFNLAMLPSLLKDFDFIGVGNILVDYFTQAKSMVQQQNISGALMKLQQANQLAPGSPNLNFNLSLLYEAEDQLIPAMNHANNYLKLAPGAADRADVENRIGEIQQELQRNPRVVMDSSGCRDILAWAQTEREVAKRSKDAARLQGILEISIASQRGECEKARSLAAGYKERYR